MQHTSEAPSDEYRRSIIAFLAGVGRPVKTADIAAHFVQREDHTRYVLDGLQALNYVACALGDEAFGMGWVTTGRWNPSLLDDGRPDASTRLSA